MANKNYVSRRPTLNLDLIDHGADSWMASMGALAVIITHVDDGYFVKANWDTESQISAFGLSHAKACAQNMVYREVVRMAKVYGICN